MLINFIKCCGMLMLLLLCALSLSKKDKRSIVPYGAKKWKEKNTPFFRFMLWAFDGVGDQIRLFRITRSVVFVLIWLFLAGFILTLSFGWYKIQGFTKYYILLFLILIGIVRATNSVLLYMQQDCAGAMKKDWSRFKGYLKDLGKKRSSLSIRKFSKAVSLAKSMEKYCYTKEKGIYYVLEKDLDRIRTTELKKYKYACEKTEHDEKGQEYFVVFDEFHKREIFRAPIK